LVFGSDIVSRKVAIWLLIKLGWVGCPSDLDSIQSKNLAVSALKVFELKFDDPNLKLND
jgi:hypothetical protein